MKWSQTVVRHWRQSLLSPVASRSLFLSSRPVVSLRHSSSAAFSASQPLDIKISLTETGGVLKQLLPVGTAVQKGDVIALVGREGENSDGVAIASPETGRIASWYAELGQPISKGDALIELLAEDLQEDQQAWKDHLAQNKGQVTDAFLQTYFELDDVFRLQQIVKSMREEWLTVLPKSVLLYERIASLQSGAEEAQTRTDWGVLLFNMGNLQGALEQLQLALRIRQETFGESHPHIAASHIHVGAIYKQSGDLEKALEHMSKALQLQIEDVGNEQHPMIASGYNNVGALHFQMGHFHEAKENYAKALEIHTLLIESNNGQMMNADTAGTHHNLGVALKQLQETDEALEHIEKALKLRLELRTQSPGDKNLTADIAASHYAMGQIKAEAGNLEQSLSHFQSAVDIQELLYGKKSPVTAAGYNNIGAVHYQQQDFAKALEWYQKALEILQTAQPGHPDVAASLNNVGLALFQLGEYERSLEFHNQGRKLLEEAYGTDHPILATTIGSIGNVLKSLQRFEDAMVEYKAAHLLLEQALGNQHPEVASSFNNMGLLFSQQGQSNEALDSYRSAARIFAESMGPQHPNTASCHFNVGLVLKGRGDTDQAKEAFRQARDIWQASLGGSHPNTEMAIQTLQECK